MTPPEGLSRVERLIRFIECLPITSGLLAGQTFGVRAWQRSILRDLSDRQNGKRIVRQALITMPSKQGNRLSRRLWRWLTCAGRRRNLAARCIAQQQTGIRRR